jgi:hypothetical protein
MMDGGAVAVEEGAMDSTGILMRESVRQRAYLDRGLDPEAYAIAEQRFAWARRQADRRRLWALLARRPWGLHALEVGGLRPGPAVAAVVPLARVIGSAGRTAEFDGAFFPLADYTRARWVGVGAAWWRGADLPPVRLLAVGDAYFVADGHHRVSVARAFGASEVAALVTGLGSAREGAL